MRHYLNQWWPDSLTHICGTRQSWVKADRCRGIHSCPRKSNIRQGSIPFFMKYIYWKANILSIATWYMFKLHLVTEFFLGTPRPFTYTHSELLSPASHVIQDKGSYHCRALMVSLTGNYWPQLDGQLACWLEQTSLLCGIRLQKGQWFLRYAWWNSKNTFFTLLRLCLVKPVVRWSLISVIQVFFSCQWIEYRL